MTALAFTETFTVVHCARCGIAFGITEDFEERRRKDHGDFTCPAGHSNIFNAKTEAEKLRDQVAALQGRLDQTAATLASARKETAAAKKETATVRGKLTRVRKRVHNGVCPCCNRTFQNLARHMATKHPEHAPTTDAAAGSA